MEKKEYHRLRQRIIATTLSFSLIPLFVLGFTIYSKFRISYTAKIVESLKTVLYWLPPAGQKPVATNKKKAKKPCKNPPTHERRSMQANASQILHKVLYGARMARPDLAKAISDLACYIHNWTAECDV